MPVGVMLKRRCCVLESLSNSGLLVFIEIFLVAAALLNFVLTRGNSRQVSALKRENHRLRNILADVMIDNSKLKA